MLDRERLDVVNITGHERWSEVKIDAARAAAAARTPVLVQKPPASTFEQCQQLVEASEAGSLKLAVNQCGRWASAFYATRQLIAAGGIGTSRMLTLTARRLPRSSDVLVTFSVHSVDARRYLPGETLGREPWRVYVLFTEAHYPEQRLINITLDNGAGMQGAV